MKKIIGVFVGMLLTGSLSAQANSNENYVSTKTYLDYPAGGTAKTAQKVEYYDGIGRSMQIVDVQASPGKKDVVTHFDYDSFGRNVYNYLPVPQVGTQYGGIYDSPLANAPSVYGSEKIFSEKVLENSPLSRIQQQKHEGWDWSTRPVFFEEGTNADGEVRKVVTSTEIINGIIITNIDFNLSGGTYNPGELYKKTVIDEDGNKTTEFTNGKGQKILSRKTTGGSDTADTYYVYNEYGQLAYIFPPLLSIKTSWGPKDINPAAYSYRYDGRGRMVEKKIPGKGIESRVYNRLDRLILAQDPALAGKNEWLFTKYDKFGRVIYTGTISNSQTREELQELADNDTGPTDENRNEAFDHSNIKVEYSNNAFPTDIKEVLTIKYYDKHMGFVDDTYFPTVILGQEVILRNSQDQAKGLLADSFMKNLEDNEWTKTFYAYDNMGREIASHSINHLGGYTRKESQLSFSGTVKKMITYHRKTKSGKEKKITEDFEYDHQDRLLKHWHQVDSEPVELLAENTYNEISQPVNKKVGNNLQSIDYTYNIRGFRTKINDPENLGGKLFGYHIKYEKPETNLYLAKYNGNISEIDWKTADDGTFRRYNYTYDGLDRLTLAAYTEPNITSPYNNAYTESLFYDLEGNIQNLTRNTYIPGQGVRPMDNLTYKYAARRLLSVTDNSGVYDGYPDSSGIPMTYDLNGNMSSHEDKGILKIGYNHLNLPNKITFNKAFLSHDMTNSYKSYSKYIYRADGIKVRKEFVYGTGPSSLETHKITEYLDGFQYTDDILNFIPTSEGYYNFEQKKYIYNYTDQVGNVRLSFYKGANGTAEIDRVTNYYPFGLEFNENIVPVNSITQNYRYSTQGQEKQEDTKWSSFKWRNYDPTFGRFFNVDPLAESYPTWSTYAFSGNRVVDSRELEGLEPLPTNMARVYESHLKDADRLDRQGRSYEAAKIRERADLMQEVNTAIISAPIFEIEEVILTFRAAQGAGFFARAWNAIKGIVTGAEASSGIAETTIGKVPNPYGKAGGPLHQAKIEEVGKKLDADGFTEIKTEVKIDTPLGSKSKRFVDIQGTNPKTGEVRQVQVGKQNQNGTPVSRERKALDDIEQATGKRPEFAPYNQLKPKIKMEEDRVIRN
nr:DUF6443 domain-containing protein [Elizabethkingia sp. ASV34]